MENSKKILILTLFSFLTTGCREFDFPVLNNNTTYKTASVEYDYETWNKWDKSFSENSIEEADSTIDFSFSTDDRNLQTFRYFIFYGAPTDCQVMIFFDDTTSQTRHTDNPFYLCFSYYFYISGPADSILGISSFSNLTFPGCSGFNPWTYIFKSNLDLYIPSNHTDAGYNWCITHELGHQLGRMAGNDAHFTHDGPLEKRPECIMNWLTVNIQSVIAKDPDYMYFCPRHVKYIKDSVSASDSPVDKNNFTGAALVQSESSTLTISLSKDEYKIFEPILVRFDYINNNSHYDTIYFNFYKYFEGIQFHITKIDDNKAYNDIMFPSPFLFGVGPRYFIAPKDTFTVSMIMNYRYGEPNIENYFGTMGYFEPGNYKVQAQDFFGSTFIKTNTTYFKIVENDSVDMQILELARSKKYQDIVNNFPLSPYCEHALAMICSDMYSTETFNIPKDDVIDTYKNFINQYPSSFYNMNIEFVDSYFAKMTNKTESFSQLIDNSLVIGNGTLFEKFITNKAVKERLSKNFIKLKQKLEEQKKNKK